MAKTRSRSRKPRASASRAKGTKKSGAKRPKTPAKKLAKQVPPAGIDIKKLRGDIVGAIAKLQKRIDAGDPAKRLPETRDAFKRWAMDIDTTVCADPEGPCGPDMFIGS